MTSTTYTISAAHRITGKSRTTISKHIKSGKLSASKDADGNPVIDASELIRVYGDACDFGQEVGGTPTSKPAENKATRKTAQGVQPEVHTLQTLLDKEIAERDRERQHHREQIEHLEKALERAQEGHNRATLLLEQRANGGGDLREAVEKMQSEMVSLRKSAKEDAKRELLDRPWWHLLKA